jgi:hypothetical protein
VLHRAGVERCRWLVRGLVVGHSCSPRAFLSDRTVGDFAVTDCFLTSPDLINFTPEVHSNLKMHRFYFSSTNHSADTLDLAADKIVWEGTCEVAGQGLSDVTDGSRLPGYLLGLATALRWQAVPRIWSPRLDSIGIRRPTQSEAARCSRFR